MFATIRTFWQRWQGARETPQTRRVLFLKQRALADDLRKLMRSYERRLDYLQARLLKLDDARLLQDRTLFEDAHQSFERLVARLRAADHDAEGLLREWRDWLDHHDPQTLSREAKDRLEILRSELSVRGLLPTIPRARTVASSVAAKSPLKRARYQPVTLSVEPFSVFERVYAHRVAHERAWVERHWRRAVGQGANMAWKVWLTRRYKRVSGLKKRLSRLIP